MKSLVEANPIGHYSEREWRCWSEQGRLPSRCLELQVFRSTHLSSSQASCLDGICVNLSSSAWTISVGVGESSSSVCGSRTRLVLSSISDGIGRTSIVIKNDSFEIGDEEVRFSFSLLKELSWSLPLGSHRSDLPCPSSLARIPWLTLTTEGDRTGPKFFVFLIHQTDRSGTTLFHVRFSGIWVDTTGVLSKEMSKSERRGVEAEGVKRRQWDGSQLVAKQKSDDFQPLVSPGARGTLTA